MKLFDLINPVKIMAFFTLYGGGSGGGASNPDTRYANLDALYGTQNQASQFMLDNAQPKIPGLMKNSQSMVNEAMDGTLASTMRNRASYDANESIASSNADAMRNLTKYGAAGDPSSGRFSDMISAGSRNSAATRVGAMNKANQFAEEQKWNRNANFYGQVMGMNSGAMQGMSSAGAGMGAIAGQQTANDQRNAAGYGQAGAAFGSALMKANGGYIDGEKPVRLADGGDAWAAYKAANPVKPMSGNGSTKRTNPVAAMLSGAAPSLLGGALKDVFSDKSKIASGFKKAGEYAKLLTSSQDAPIADTATGAVQYADGTTAMYGGDIGADGAAAAVGYGATGAPEGITYGGDIAADGVATAAPVVADVGTEAAPAALEIFGTAFAKGGSVKKHGKCMAAGGLAQAARMPGMAGMDTSGNMSIAQMDASNNMSVAKMDDLAQKKAETHAVPVTQSGFSGKTDGMGESSSGDPDGFGKEGADNRHMAGKATMSVVGRWLGGPLGGMAGSVLSEALHPVGEAVSRTVINAGDKMGGAGGALVLDPIGTTMSGKYSNADLAKGHLSVALGAPGLSKYLANGGRVDHTAGGEVDGPGTETSDDIPAWLSDGEFVLNSEAVKLVGKDKLEQINNAGLEKRKAGALGMACGGAVKHGVKMAGGGFLGGNLGIAMGAGVDEWNRQRQNNRADRADARAEATDVRQNAVVDAQLKDVNRRNTERNAAMAVWKDAQPVFQGGADAAAQKLLEKYNANDAALGYNDGHTAKLTKTDKGYTVTRAAQDGTEVDSQTFTPQQVVQEHARSIYANLAAINPVYGEKFMGWIENQGKASAASQEKAADRAHQERIAQVGADARRYGADVSANATLKAAGLRAEHQGQPKGPTLSQERSNAEIDAARNAVAGLTPQEIQRKTAKTTNTGRENPDFDPTLERAVTLSGRRKVGADDHFDQRQQGQEQAPAAMFDRADVAKRFRSEREMDNFTLGKETPNGIEVLSKGKVVGHYR